MSALLCCFFCWQTSPPYSGYHKVYLYSPYSASLSLPHANTTPSLIHRHGLPTRPLKTSVASRSSLPACTSPEPSPFLSPAGTCAVIVTKSGTCRSLVANLAAANHFTKSHLEIAENKALMEKANFYYISVSSRGFLVRFLLEV